MKILFTIYVDLESVLVPENNGSQNPYTNPYSLIWIIIKNILLVVMVLNYCVLMMYLASLLSFS